MAQKENRKHLRVPVDWPVVILDGTGACNARLKDISANGAFVVSDTPLQPRKQLILFIIPLGSFLIIIQLVRRIKNYLGQLKALRGEKQDSVT